MITAYVPKPNAEKVEEREMSYESPVTLAAQAAERIVKYTEERALEVIFNTGITVDKDELIKALLYDRQQYEKGFADGAASGAGAANVVRCKDCRFCRKGRAGLYCSFVDFLIGEDDYCSKGAMKDDG